MFIDSIEIDAIKEGLLLGCIKGVTTNPSLLLKGNKPRAIQLKEIFALDLDIVFVQLVGETKKELLEDLDRIIAEKHFLDPDQRIKLGVKVAVSIEGLKALKEIKETYPQMITLGTAIYSATQGIVAAQAGFDYLAPYVNRMQSHQLDPYEEIACIKNYIQSHGLQTKILAASFKDKDQVMKALASGADTVTVSKKVLKEMIENPLAKEGIRVFNEDGKKLQEIH